MIAKTMKPLARLKEFIQESSRSDDRSLRAVKVNKSFATEFVGLSLQDWLDQSNGWMSEKECSALAQDFLMRGPMAINGLYFGVFRIRLELDESASAPEMTAVY